MCIDCRKILSDGARRTQEDVNRFVDPHVDGVTERLFAGARVVSRDDATIAHLHAVHYTGHAVTQCSPMTVFLQVRILTVLISRYILYFYSM